MATERRGLWTPHQTHDGKIYWYNAATNTSSWTKPDQGDPVLQSTYVDSSVSINNDGSFLDKFLQMQQNSQEGGTQQQLGGIDR